MWIRPDCKNLASPDTDPSAVVKRDEAVAEATADRASGHVPERACGVLAARRLRLPSRRSGDGLAPVGISGASNCAPSPRTSVCTRAAVQRFIERPCRTGARFLPGIPEHTGGIRRPTSSVWFSTFLRTRPQIGLNLADFGSICGLVRRNVAYAGRPSGSRTVGRRSR